MSYKEELYKKCIQCVQKREHTVTSIISSHKNALGSETKSSAGDKHETGRAMLQLEMEKAGQQLHAITLMKETLAKIDITKQGKLVHLGSLVTTNLATYFISISAGELKIMDTKYFAISLSSPIGKLLLGKRKGDKITFNNKQIEVLKIT